MSERKSFVDSIKENLESQAPKSDEVKGKSMEENFVDAIKQNIKEGVKSRVKNSVVHDSHASDDSHVFDRMADVMYGMTTKMPLFGQYAKVPIDKIDGLNRTKVFTSKAFKPIFPFFKVNPKYTSFLVNQAPEHKTENDIEDIELEINLKTKESE